MNTNYSRPWEILPQDVLNLLAMHSLYAYWDRDERCWRVHKGRGTVGLMADGTPDWSILIPEPSNIQYWIMAISKVPPWK